ncbi:MAG TPA: hypothetical protein VJ617_13185 [Arthrobacter sp.]|nr:hypothetical protein [Arthrobacter sp.]
MDTSRLYLPPDRDIRPSHHGYQRSLVANWSELSPGDTVVLLGTGKPEARTSGEVDAVSVDGSLLWLLQDDCGGRRLFHWSDGYKTLVDPANRLWEGPKRRPA